MLTSMRFDSSTGYDMLSYEEWAEKCPYMVHFFDGTSRTATVCDNTVDWNEVKLQTYNYGPNGEYVDYVREFTCRNKYFC